MHLIIKSTLKTLKKAELLLDNLNDDMLSNSSVSPYYSSIGSHVRHILDFYDCIFNIDLENKIDLTARKRDLSVECECEKAKYYLNSILEKLVNVEFNMNNQILVVDDLGLGKVEMSYSFGAILSQANSHTIHHYAIINYILKELNYSVKDLDFGYNPTTPMKCSSN